MLIFGQFRWVYINFAFGPIAAYLNLCIEDEEDATTCNLGDLVF